MDLALPVRRVEAILARLLVATIISTSVLVGYSNFRILRLLDEVIYASHFPTGDRFMDKLLIVKVDDKSLARLGSWPWDRSVFARLIESIASANPPVIAIDFAFEASRSKEGDMELAEVVGRENRRVVLASLRSDRGAVRLYPELAAKGPTIGYVNTGTGDELESTVAMPCRNDRSIPVFAEEVARKYLESRASAEPHGGEGRIPESAHPMYRRFGECALPINFTGGLNAVKSVSALDVLNAPTNALLIPAGSVVIVGPYSEIHGDFHYSPISRGRITPGPVIVAHAVNTAISGIYIRAVGYWTLGLLSTGAAFAALWCFQDRVRLGRAILSCIALGVSILAVHILAFWYARYYFPVTPIFGGISIAFVPRALELLGIRVAKT